jgi:hypothetical protein
LTLKFGALPTSSAHRVARAGADELDAFIERVLTAQTLEEVFTD